MKKAKEIKKFKRQMRSRPTKAELLFKNRLDKAWIEYKFQMILGFYILDFVFPDKCLCIEVDGSSHNNKGDYDKRRDGFVSRCGIKTIRIKNEEVEDFDLNIILNHKEKPVTKFRSALAKANSLRNYHMRVQGLSKTAKSLLL